MIVSFLLARGQPNSKYQIDKDSLRTHALPLAKQAVFEASIAGQEPDAFAAFVVALFEDFDLDHASNLVTKISD